MFLRFFDKNILSSDFKERIKEIFKWKRRFFYEELEYLFSDVVWNSKEFEENLFKTTKVIQEKLSSTNRPFFEKIYPGFTNNITEDKSSKSNFIVRYYTSKLVEN